MKLTNAAKKALHGHGIPEYMHGAIIRYYENGISPGGFLTAVINNDLKGAFACADDQNIRCISEYITWFYWYAPGGTWGYPGAVENYIEQFHEKAQAK